jgi:CheY-like chemotaxis protein
MASVLIVDDSSDVRETLGDLLELEGFSVRRAANGKQALAAVARGRLPDVILLDLVMPGLSGEGVLRALGSTPGRGVPVVVMTGFGVSELARRLGVPVVPKEFGPVLSALRSICDQPQPFVSS